MGSSAPIRLLGEATGHVVSLELNDGTGYRGKLEENEDNMNVQLTDVTVTSRGGTVNHLDQVFIRGSQVRFFSLPDILKEAPVLAGHKLEKK